MSMDKTLDKNIQTFLRLLPNGHCISDMAAKLDIATAVRTRPHRYSDIYYLPHNVTYMLGMSIYQNLEWTKDGVSAQKWLASDFVKCASEQDPSLFGAGMIFTNYTVKLPYVCFETEYATTSKSCELKHRNKKLDAAWEEYMKFFLKTNLPAAQVKKILEESEQYRKKDRKPADGASKLDVSQDTGPSL